MTERLRRQRPCAIRMSTDLTSPRCGKPAVEKREDSGLWACREHRLYGQTFTPNPGRLPAIRGARRRRPEPRELLGFPVMVTNPNTHDVWLGTGVAIAQTPSILIEDDRGHRFMLPLEWARGRQG
ncbi:hypothetical protein QDA05_gp11 [Microbacterium phage Honeyfin]|uniref:Uncharacterized protein n=5 Tax=Quhwahvirus TaxID=2733202 RepID=A0A4Y5NZZ7_9CAUD|nr:hypothetical protein QDA05_gp11 [Microbacterium phage Honeyfin]QCW22568.1 hypothetical protein SEA_PIPERIS_10 [Microbacterium phage Piperis]QOC58034.1 hypothetical protein SEA_SCUMBERLAND_11 [Microbacterium phage Scumberland]QTF81527.1 hypothetical protein SEA_PULCHRA_11 [Microbacterium phage Pulchra]QWY84791.1 hypothetical protein SEA_SELWYN23_11 [Microbacterium phage Selwyn23]QXN74803.1 hypothetical protein SEA_PHRANCESCO_11 [Microbacterium phage Phrancesco]UXE04585.1 hypothetical protei